MIVYLCSGVISRHPPFLKIFSSETTWPIKAKFCVESLGRGNESLYKWSRSHDQDGHHAHIWQKPLKIFSRTKSLLILKLGMQHWGLKLYKICINDDPGLTFTYFMTRSNLVSNAFFFMGNALKRQKTVFQYLAWFGPQKRPTIPYMESPWVTLNLFWSIY